MLLVLCKAETGMRGDGRVLGSSWRELERQRAEGSGGGALDSYSFRAPGHPNRIAGPLDRVLLRACAPPYSDNLASRFPPPGQKTWRPGHFDPQAVAYVDAYAAATGGWPMAKPDRGLRRSQTAPAGQTITTTPWSRPAPDRQKGPPLGHPHSARGSRLTILPRPG